MSEIKESFRYANSHEWVEVLASGHYRVGISAFGSQALGDLVYVELPEVGQRVQTGDEVCVVESVKAASDVYAPMTGEIVAINESLVDAPGLVNQHAYADGWLFEIAADVSKEYDGLLSAAEYAEVVAASADEAVDADLFQDAEDEEND